MTQASQILVCTYQADGSYTLNASPDITCFVPYGDWANMLPLSIILYVIFGGGAILFFVLVYIYSRFLRARTISLAKQIRTHKIKIARTAHLSRIPSRDMGDDETDEDEDAHNIDGELQSLEKKQDAVINWTKNFDM
jgi:hypothetical protein